MAFREVERVHHHARGAEAALQAVVLLERLLHRVQRAVGLGHALDGHQVGAFCLHCNNRAALDRAAVHEHGAGAALGGVAADVGAGEPQVLADVGDEQGARLDFRGNGLAVDLHGYFDCHAVLLGGKILARIICATRMRLLIVEDDAPLASGLQRILEAEGHAVDVTLARRGRGARRVAREVRPGDPGHRPAADGRLRGAAAAARVGAGQERPDAGAGAHRARRGRGPRARPRPRRRRLHGEALRHAGADRAGARAAAPLAGARRAAHRARAADARHGRQKGILEKRAPGARGARVGGARSAARARWRRSCRRRRSSRRWRAGATISRPTRSRSTSRACARSSSRPASSIRTVRGFGYMLEEFK